MKDAWRICPACKGDGHCVNPAIDAHGLTAEDFAEDPDFAEDYFAGTYNEPCRACTGSGKLRASAIKALHKKAADRRLGAREDGDWESYQVAHDLRWG